MYEPLASQTGARFSTPIGQNEGCILAVRERHREPVILPGGPSMVRRPDGGASGGDGAGGQNLLRPFENLGRSGR